MWHLLVTEHTKDVQNLTIAVQDYFSKLPCKPQETVHLLHCTSRRSGNVETSV